MSKHPDKKNHLFYYKDITDKVFCPLCHKPAKAVVPATTVTYLVHSRDDICVIDWRTASEFNLGVQDG